MLLSRRKQKAPFSLLLPFPVLCVYSFFDVLIYPPLPLSHGFRTHPHSPLWPPYPRPSSLDGPTRPVPCTAPSHSIPRGPGRLGHARCLLQAHGLSLSPPTAPVAGSVGRGTPNDSRESADGVLPALSPGCLLQEKGDRGRPLGSPDKTPETLRAPVCYSLSQPQPLLPGLPGPLGQKIPGQAEAICLENKPRAEPPQDGPEGFGLIPKLRAPTKPHQSGGVGGGGWISGCCFRAACLF